jgi:hypothetical protein
MSKSQYPFTLIVRGYELQNTYEMTIKGKTSTQTLDLKTNKN